MSFVRLLICSSTPFLGSPGSPPGGTSSIPQGYEEFVEEMSKSGEKSRL
jgi:hypothetical protein